VKAQYAAPDSDLKIVSHCHDRKKNDPNPLIRFELWRHPAAYSHIDDVSRHGSPKQNCFTLP
jgi:hypothetical protein